MAGKKIFTDHEYQTSAHLVTPKVHTVPNISSHAGVLGQLAASGNNLYFHDGSNWFALIESNYAGALTGRPSFDPASGNIPFTVGAGHNDRVDNLNADLLDGYDTSTSAVASKIPVYGTSGVLKVGTPVATGDATTKAYVDDLVQGLDIKASVAAASTASLTLSGTQTVDGVSLSAGNRVLVKDQSTASQNGIYIVASGSWALAEDSDAGSLSEGAYVFVEGGTVNNNTGWTYTDSTSYTWAKFSGAGQLNAGDGLVKSGDTLNANVAAPISIVSDQITIADGAITGSKLANNTVTSTQLADSIQLNHIGLGVAPDTTYRLKTAGKSRFYNTTDIALLAETTGTNTAVFNTTSAPPNYIVDFRLAGNSKVRIEPDGDLHAVEKIGVGTSPSHRLHIKDNADTNNGGIAIERSSTGDNGYFNMRGGRLGLVTETALPIKFYTNNTSRLEIESDGDVKVINKLGIGVTPSFHLHVAAGNKLLAGGYTLLERTPNGENNNTLYVQSTGSDNNQALAKFTYGATAGGANTGNETFVVARSASYFNSKLGIGVTPSEKLHVNGNIRLPNTTDTTSGIIYKDTSRFIHNYQHPTGDTAVPAGLNTFVGISAGSLSMGSTATSVSHGSYNSGFGYQVLTSLTTGYSNTAVGREAGKDITTGYSNTMVGKSAGSNIIGGIRNIFIGDAAGLINTSGNYNTIVGYNGLRQNATGAANTAIGSLSLENHTASAGNTALGYQSLRYLTTGQYNIAIGYAAGSQKVATGNLTNASYGIYLGYGVGGTEGASGEIVIGKDADGSGSNTTTIGGSSTTNTYIPYGNFNIANLPTSTADNSLIVESSGLLKKRTANSGIFTTNFGANRFLVSDNSGVITSDSRLVHLGGRVSFTGSIDGTANLKVDLVSDAITTNQTSYEKCFYASGLNGYNISSGVTDSGYRIAVDASAFVSDSTFAGTLANQKAVWARHGANVSASGSTITDSYGVFIDSLTNSNTTITNLWGLYQSSSAAKNYFAGSVGIGVTPTTDFTVKGRFTYNDSTRLLTIVNSTNTGGINLSGGNSRIYFTNRRAIEGSTDGSNLTIGEGYTNTTISGGATLGSLPTSTTDTNVIVESSGLLKKRATHPGAFAVTQTSSSTDLNSVSDGWYRWSGSGNKPVNGPTLYSVMLQQEDASQKIQLAYGGSSYGKLFIRRADSGTFYDWTEFYSTENLTLSTLGGVGGSGTVGKIPLWTGNTTTLGDSVITQSNSNVGVGASADSNYKLYVDGDTKVNGDIFQNSGNALFLNENRGWYRQNYTTTGAGVSNGKTVTLNKTHNQTASAAYHYRFQLSTVGTGTNTGATYIGVYNNDSSQWNLRAVSLSGAHSNHPQLSVSGSTFTAYTEHSSNYTISVSVETIYNGEADSTAHSLGADYHWRRFDTDLYYTNGNVGIGTTSPANKFHINIGANLNWIFGYPSNTTTSLAALNDAESAYVDARIDGLTLALNSQSGGNVGIGTNDPDYKLQVNEKNINSNPLRVVANINTNDSGYNTLLISNGGTDPQSTPRPAGIHFKSPTFGSTNSYSSGRIIGYFDTTGGTNPGFGGAVLGLQYPTADNTFTTGLVLRGGNVGIGTDDPDSLLHVKSSTAAGANFILETTNSGGIPLLDLKGAHSAQLRYKDELDVIQGRIDFGDSGTFNFIDVPNNKSTLYLETGGNVGIGTDDPDLKLDVQATGVQANLGVERTDGSWATLYGGSSFSGVAFDNTTYFKIAPGATANRTDTSGSGLIVDASGNVGIDGTPNSSYKLDVAGDVLIQDVKSGELKILVNNTSTSTLARTAVELINDSGSSAGLILPSINYTPVTGWDNRLILNTDSQISNGILARPSNGGFTVSTTGLANNDFVVEDSTGNVGINCTPNSSFKLDVNGGGRFTTSLRSDGYITISSDTAEFYIANAAVNKFWRQRLSANGSEYNLKFDYNDGASNITPLTLSNTGHATFSGTITSTNNANSAGDNIVVSTTNKSVDIYAISSKRSGTTVGGMRIDGKFRASDGSVGAPAYAFIDDPNTGMARAGADHLKFVTGGTSRLELTSGGAVKATRDGGSNLIQVARIHDGSLTGNGTATSFTITHNLETGKPIAVVIDDDSGAYVEAQIVVASDNAISVTFNNPPASGKVYRVPVTG